MGQLANADWTSVASLESAQAAWADALGGNTDSLNNLFGGMADLT
jgi:hypothetical protein